MRQHNLRAAFQFSKLEKYVGDQKANLRSGVIFFFASLLLWLEREKNYARTQITEIKGEGMIAGYQKARCLIMLLIIDDPSL